MKRLTWFLVATFATSLAMGVGIIGCSDDGDDDENTNTVSGLTCTGTDCVLTGVIKDNITLSAGNSYLLRGGVFIGDSTTNVTLTIEPGTVIRGESSTRAFLVIERGSKIMAEGTKTAPIVFTSDKAVGSRAPGDWGGLVINGRAPLNTGSEAIGEGATGAYGGTNPDDNSGVLKYVRVEFGGKIISPDNELNCIAFQGVGRGTTIDYVQAHLGKDDGIEFFGGTANIRHAVITGAEDDCFDWTDGWSGKGQFIVAQQYAAASDNGIEADNNAENNDATPRSHPMLSNVTMIGSPDSSHSDLGMLIREGTAANLYNTIVLGFNEAGMDIDQDATYANGYSDYAAGTLTGELTIMNSIVWGAGHPSFLNDSGEPVQVSDWFMTHNSGNMETDPMLTDAFNETSPNWLPASGSPASSGGMQPSDSWFQAATYKGAIDPANDWTKGWTTSAKN